MKKVQVAFKLYDDSIILEYVRKRMREVPRDSKRNGTTRRYSMANIIKDLLEDAVRERLRESKDEK